MVTALGTRKIKPLSLSKRVVATNGCGSELKVLYTVISPRAFCTTCFSSVAGYWRLISFSAKRYCPGSLPRVGSGVAYSSLTVRFIEKATASIFGRTTTLALPSETYSSPPISIRPADKKYHFFLRLLGLPPVRRPLPRGGSLGGRIFPHKLAPILADFCSQSSSIASVRLASTKRRGLMVSILSSAVLIRG